MKEWLKDKVPPGAELDREFGWARNGLIISAVFSFGYFITYWSHYKDLFTWRNGEKVENLWETYGYYMDAFWDLADFWMVGFLIVIIAMVALSIYHYSSFRSGSQSIYVMKRLPEASELHIRCLTLPVLTILACIIAALLLLIIYYAVYMLATPDTAICPDLYGRIFGKPYGNTNPVYYIIPEVS